MSINNIMNVNENNRVITESIYNIYTGTTRGGVHCNKNYLVD